MPQADKYQILSIAEEAMGKNTVLRETILKRKPLGNEGQPTVEARIPAGAAKMQRPMASVLLQPSGNPNGNVFEIGDSKELMSTIQMKGKALCSLDHCG